MAKRASTDHVVWDFNRNKMACLRCEATHAIQFPASVRDFAAQCKAFVRLHRDCKPAGTEKPA